MQVYYEGTRSYMTSRLQHFVMLPINSIDSIKTIQHSTVIYSISCFTYLIKMRTAHRLSDHNSGNLKLGNKHGHHCRGTRKLGHIKFIDVTELPAAE